MLLSGVAVMAFSVIFNVPRRELVFCGLTGICTWVVFTLITHFFPEASNLGTFFAAATATVIARILSDLRRLPSTIYMIPGVIPLVPGLRIYFTMFYMVNGEVSNAVVAGIGALSTAGAIAMGLLVVLSLPRKWFSVKRRKV